MTHVDTTGIEALEDITKDLRRDGITLVVAHLRTRMREQFDEAGVLGHDRRGALPTVRAAVDAYTSRDGGS